MKSEDVPFEGGPMDGRVLPVLVGMTGRPPKTYRIPVPGAGGRPPTVLVYRRAPRERSGGIGFVRWTYRYVPEGSAARDRPRLPWPKPRARPDAAPDAAPDNAPDAAPGGKPDDADG
ncbi:hypothetical protein NGM37_37455 [Streptomyces sp. TRM76130]|nr:hypothetical protein [Streptomyces sp. TRM76130]